MQNAEQRGQKANEGQERPQQSAILWLTRTAMLLAITLAFQMLGLPQPVTGPAVNAMLLLSAIFAGMSSGIVIGLLTPWIAFIRGILAAPLGPMIPFIMLGNAALVLVFYIIRRLGSETILSSIAGVVAGAVVKFLILSSAVRYVVEVKPAIAKAMQLPQLFTALIGGAVALIVAEGVRAAIRARK